MAWCLVKDKENFTVFPRTFGAWTLNIVYCI